MEGPASRKERRKWLKKIDEEWQQEQKARSNNELSAASPWAGYNGIEDEAAAKEAWAKAKLYEARQMRRHWAEQGEARWAEKSAEEKRRAIKLQLQHRKAREAFGASLPHSGTNWMAPEWFGDFPVPWGIETAEGFDTEALVQRVEAVRARGVACLRAGGIKNLLEKIEDLEGVLERGRSQYAVNEERSEEIVYSLYPEPEQSQQRILDMLKFSGYGRMAVHEGEEERKELAEISRQQQVLLADMRVLHFNRWVLGNVLNRERRALPNTPEAWRALYARFEVDPNELQRAYAEAGVPVKDSQHDPYHTTLKLRDAYRERCKKVKHGEERPFRLKKDLKEWAVREFGLSATELERTLTVSRVWVKGKKGSPGAGLSETLANLKVFPKSRS